MSSMLLGDYLFLYFAAHALGDFVLQPEAMGYGKNRHNTIHDRPQSRFPNWWYWLSAHALVHGGVIYAVTYSLFSSPLALIFGLIETVTHWCTDYAKCEGWISMHLDQAIHLGCKVLYAFLLVNLLA